MTSDGSFWQDRRVFVTGASGLLGGWLVRHLLDLEADVVCLLRDWVPDSDLIDNLYDQVSIVRGDVRDRDLLERALGEYEIQTVFHLAAQTIVQIANRNPVSTFESNIQGTWNTLEACRRSPTVEQIVAASSDKAYGSQDDLPYDETMPLQGEHPYDVSKSCADLITQTYTGTYGLPAAITRCGNLYGGGDLNWNRLIPGTIRSVLRGQRPVLRSDGQHVRDFLYVEDAALANIQLAEAIDGDPDLCGEGYNLSLEERKTVLEVVEVILDLMDADLKPRILDQAEGEIESQYLDASKARRAFDWTPRYTMREGLSSTIDWYEQYFQPT